MLLESSKTHTSVIASRATLMHYTDQIRLVLSIFFLGVVSLPSLNIERLPSFSETPVNLDLSVLSSVCDGLMCTRL